MFSASNFAWLLLIAGVILQAMGVIWILLPSIAWLGRLPGDIRVERSNVRVYFPLLMCMLISLALTIILGLVHLFRG